LSPAWPRPGSRLAAPGPARVSRVIAALASRLLRARWLVRAPVWVYRARLGAVFGSRLVMLEHTGRRTGARRYVVLEVLDRPAPGKRIVASGFGARSQWYRNVLAAPRVQVYEWSRPPAVAMARPMARDEASAVLARYSSGHPRAWAVLRPLLEATLNARVGTEGSGLPLVVLESPAPEVSPTANPDDTA